MGHGAIVKCGNCGKETIYMLGVGALYSSLDTVLANTKIRKEKKNDIQNKLRYFNPDSVSYEHRLYTCPKCEILHERFYIKISNNNKTIYETEFRCGICRSKLTPANKSISSYRCGECRTRNLEWFDNFLWD